jgi:hypothetical protein
MNDTHRAGVREISRELMQSREDGPDVLLKWLSKNALLDETIPHQTIRAFMNRLACHLLLFSSPAEMPVVRAPMHVWQATRGLGAGPDVWLRAGGPCVSGSVIEADHATLMKAPAVRTIALEINRACGETGG